jgi:hypothetical protein
VRRRRPELPEALDRVVRRCLAPQSEARYPSAEELALALEGCRDLLHAEREMPPAGPLTRASQRWPIFMGFALSLVPHVLGSLLSIGYNVLRIGGDLPPAEQGLVLWLTVAYTLLVFVVAVSAAWWVVAPTAHGLRRLRAPEALDEKDLAALRRFALNMPLWGIGLSALGWLPGAGLVPLALGWLSGQPVPAGIYLHFLLSFGVAGLMAMPYNIYAMQFLVLRVVYPRLLSADPRRARETARAELGFQRRRLFRLQFLAGLVPLLSAAAMVAAGPDRTSSGYAAFSLLVIGLIVLGGVGLVLALLLGDTLNRTLTALTQSSAGTREAYS